MHRKIMYSTKVLIIPFAIIFTYTECANILCVFQAPAVSHQAIFQPIWKELSLRGHRVVVITPNPLKDVSLTNLTEIDVSFTYDLRHQCNVIANLVDEKSSSLKKVDVLYEFGSNAVESIFQYELVQNLMINSKVDFDVILVQQTHNWNLVHAIVSKLKAPVVAISSLSLFLHSHDILGNPTHPIISPDMMLNFSGKLSFFDKVQSLLFNFWYRIYYYWYALPKADTIARKYFGQDMPYLGDLEKNISLLLVNVNPIIHGVRPNVPNVIEINQLHIRPQKPLPQDIQDYLDSSTQGVVYFSLGSNVKSANLTERVRKEIIGALSELPYKVLWKWENDYLPDQPANVMTRKWLPQQDILRHPNIKVFVTQGGLQSIEEAITFEVPMVGIPFITDQPSNVRKMVDLGMGLEIDYKIINKDKLRDSILEVGKNKKYKEAVQKSRAILLDQPMIGVEKAIWWIEYVIRHKGAKHLRSAAADMSFFEYFMIDVVLFLFACCIVILYTLTKFFSLFKFKKVVKKDKES